MERKRKLPARAAARAEQLAKRRNASTRDRTKTPTPPPPPPEPIVEPSPPTPPRPPLPTSVESGKPLPTIEVAQSHDLSPEEFQSISESGVLAESLARSRQRWISEGLFEKYWTKPHKKKGVLIEDPKNPPKDSMNKIGNVTITIEPHIVEATMYAVKGPKPKPSPHVLQKPPQQQPARPIIHLVHNQLVNKLQHQLHRIMPRPAQAVHNASQHLQAIHKVSRLARRQEQRRLRYNPRLLLPREQHTLPLQDRPSKPPLRGLLQLQKASSDPELRDLMKRVAVGQAKPGELAHFQKIIDQLNAEYKSKGGQQGPSADRLSVDGRTVKYFAEEVRTILDIVLASNPNQKSSELRPPPGSDPLVVLLVKTALEDVRTRDMIRRIAENRPGNTDATDLKETLDRLNRDAKTAPQGFHAQPSGRQLTPNGVSNNGMRTQQSHLTNSINPQQPMRAKAPAAASRPDIAAVCFDFGAGDRFLFPKFSILEFLPTTSGQQVVASFLIVRKGSTSEYGGDPQLDYYQPVTIRLQTNTGRHLENLARVVAPQDEVRRYMDDVMDNMTRAEYVLLAMQLPRHAQNPDEVETSKGIEKNSPVSNAEQEKAEIVKPGVLWTVSAGSNRASMTPSRQIPRIDAEEEAQQKYQKLIRSIEEKEYEYV
ncbi:SWR1-complex protein 3 [Beauveria bassiana]|nr:SWR1-complex protein 3 [Beauveria bassiana]